MIHENDKTGHSGAIFESREKISVIPNARRTGKWRKAAAKANRIALIPMTRIGKLAEIGKLQK